MNTASSEGTTKTHNSQSITSSAEGITNSHISELTTSSPEGDPSKHHMKFSASSPEGPSNIRTPESTNSSPEGDYKEHHLSSATSSPEGTAQSPSSGPVTYSAVEVSEFNEPKNTSSSSPKILQLSTELHADVSSINNQKPWLIDSGANVVVVPPSDPNIREVLKRSRALNTAQGSVNVTDAVIDTPFGPILGVVCAGSPRLLPWALFIDNNCPIIWEEKSFCEIKTSFGKMRVPIILGTPTLNFPGILSPHNCKACAANPVDTHVEGESIAAKHSQPKDTCERISYGDIEECDTLQGKTNTNDGNTQEHIYKSTWHDNGHIIAFPARKKKKARMQPRKGVQEWDSHLQSHYPYSDSCTACRETRQIKADESRGASHVTPTPGRELILADFKGKLSTSSSGDKWILVLRWIRPDKKPEERHPCYAEPTKSREGPEVLEHLHDMRVEFGIVDKPFELKADWEGALQGPDARRYMLKHDGIIRRSIPRRSNTNAATEAAVRTVTEGGCATLRASGMPANWWHHAFRTWWVLFNRDQCGLKLHTNTVDRQIPFGTLGYAVIPKETYRAPGPAGRGVPVGFLEYARSTAGGILVTFFDKNTKKLRKTCILERDVRWTSEYAFERKLKDLQEIHKLHGSFGSSQPGLPDQAPDGPRQQIPVDDDIFWVQCEQCEKWRIVPEETFKKWKTKRGPKGHPDCADLGTSCQVPRTVLEIEQADSDADSSQDKRSANRSTKLDQKKQAHTLLARAFLVQRASILRELHDQVLDHATEGKLDQLYEEARTQALTDDHITTNSSAYVTRPCTTAEKLSPQGTEARREEMRRITEFTSVLDLPLTNQQAREKYPKATTSGIHMLTSIKFVERETTHWKYKARLVLLGNQIRELVSGKQTYPSGEQHGIYGPVTTLEGARMVFAHGLVHDYKIQTIDLPSAYLQCEWPQHVTPHLLRLPPDVYELLPTHLREAADKCGGPAHALFPMKRCLYGHPLSGHLWAERFLKYLSSKGFTSDPGDPAFLTRENTRVCIYVDDVAASGPDLELARLWREVQDEFKCGDAAECRDFLGLRITRSTTDQFREIKIDMIDYTDSILQEYKENFGTATPIYTADTPMSNTLMNEGNSPTTPQRKIQKLIGMLLWAARCGRPELSFALSRLGSRINKWTEECSVQLARCIGYLEKTRNHVLSMRVAVLDSPQDISVKIHSDADWGDPGSASIKSQSGALLFLESTRGTHVPIHWMSKRQPITADSSGMSELIAAHAAVRQFLMPSATLCNILGRTDTVTLCVDNTVVKRIAARGSSKQLAILEHSKALRVRIGILRDLRELGAIHVEYVKSTENKADIFTKPLERLKFTSGTSDLGVIPRIPVTV